MGGPRVACLVCRVKQSLQLAARSGLIARAGASTSGNNGTNTNGNATWTPENARPYSTEARGSPGGLQTPRTNYQQPHRRRMKRTDDAAMAMFQEIVESGSHHGQPWPPDQQQPQPPKKRLREKHAKQPHPTEYDWASLERKSLQRKSQMDGRSSRSSRSSRPATGTDADPDPETHAQASHGRVLHINPSLYDDLIKLTQMGSRGGPNGCTNSVANADANTADSFAFFERAMLPPMLAAKNELPKIFAQVANKLLHDVSEARARDFTAAGLPSVARITAIRRQLGLFSTPRSWLAMVLRLAERLVPDASDPLPAPQAEALAMDLVESWRLFVLPSIVAADPDALAAVDPTDFRLPTPDPHVILQYARKGRPDLAVATLLPRYAPQQLDLALPAVLATYAVLTDPTVAGAEAGQARARDFLEAVRTVLALVPLDVQHLPALFGPHERLAFHVHGRWPLVAPSEASRIASRTALPPRLGHARFTLDLERIHGQLSSALRARNLASCEQAWERFWAAVSSPDVQGVDKMERASSLFDFFIMVFATMRLPERAIQVWNVMLSIGIQPTVRTWTSFMEGCKRASNPQGIYGIWDMLVASGVPPDTAAWTARISGLIQSGETEAGLLALDEMQRKWEAWRAAEEQAHKTDRTGNTDIPPVPFAVRPTIEPVNAAIAGLIRLRDMKSARRVLAWADQHGIEPDVITFNTILRHTVRENRADEVAGVLGAMRERGIEPDEATVTILLEGTLGTGSMAGLDATQQADTVRRVLAGIDAAGLAANQQMYAKIMYLLIGDTQHETGRGRDTRVPPPVTAVNHAAHEAVAAVMDHMRARGVRMSPYIYTILAEYYFSHSPPNLVAVRHLIETGRPLHMQNDSSARDDDAFFNKSAFDRVFYERVVRGYAMAGDTHSALLYYKEIESSLSLTSSTLEDLLRALIRNGEWDAAAQFVAKVRNQKMLVASGGTHFGGAAEDARLFRHRFWHLANEHGLG